MNNYHHKRGSCHEFINEIGGEETIVKYILKTFTRNNTLEGKHKRMQTVDPGRNIYLFAEKLRDRINTLSLARLPMVCLLPYGSSREMPWLKQIKRSLGRDSILELAPRETGLLMLASPGGDLALMAYEHFLEQACHFTGWSRFISVACIGPSFQH